jgi:TetR/AcrR family transcriptional regulator, transcriptional repressor for nem operon
VKVSRVKAAEHRTALVKAASRLFREKGIDGVGVAEISKAAGLTHGALYAQFPSKDALAAEALEEGVKERERLIHALNGGEELSLSSLLDFLLSPRQRDSIGESCPMTASASEIARQDAVVRETFSRGFEDLVSVVEATVKGKSKEDRRSRALMIVSGEIGAIAVARAVRKSRPALSTQMLTAARRILGEIGGEPTSGSKERGLQKANSPGARSSRMAQKGDQAGASIVRRIYTKTN